MMRPPATENFEVHVVEAGDTLWAIARIFISNNLLPVAATLGSE